MKLNEIAQKKLLDLERAGRLARQPHSRDHIWVYAVPKGVAAFETPRSSRPKAGAKVWVTFPIDDASYKAAGDPRNHALPEDLGPGNQIWELLIDAKDSAGEVRLERLLEEILAP